MNWILWASIGYFFNSIVAVVDKSLLGREKLDNPAVYTFAISCLGLLVLVLVPFGWQATPALAWLFGILSGFCFTGALWVMFIVLKTNEASRVPAYIGSLNPLFVFAFSFVFIGERLDFWQIAAFLLLVLGGFMMVSGRGGLNQRQAGLAALSSLIFGLAFVLLKLTFFETNFVSGLIISRLGAFLSGLLLLLLPGTWDSFGHMVGKTSQGIKLSFLGGQASGALSGLFNSYAVSLASVTLVQSLQGMQYVFILVLALLISYKWPQLLQEEFSVAVLGRKIIGTVLIAGGLWWLSIG